MSVFVCLLKKELRACFYSPIAYVVMFFFWALMGVNFIWLLSQLAAGESLTLSTQLMFSGPILTFAMPFVVPLITMRLFAEERKLGTLEALLTTSVRVPELVLSKFVGAVVFYCALLLPTIIYVYILKQLCPATINDFPDGGSLWSGAAGMLFVGALYVAVGVFMSSLTSNQIIAAIGGFALIFGSLVGTAFMAYMAQSPGLRIMGQYYSSFAHMMDFSRGVLDSRIIVMYLTHTAWFIFATVKIVESKRA